MHEKAHPGGLHIVLVQWTLGQAGQVTPAETAVQLENAGEHSFEGSGGGGDGGGVGNGPSGTGAEGGGEGGGGEVGGGGGGGEGGDLTHRQSRLCVDETGKPQEGAVVL